MASPHMRSAITPRMGCHQSPGRRICPALHTRRRVLLENVALRRKLGVWKRRPFNKVAKFSRHEGDFLCDDPLWSYRAPARHFAYFFGHALLNSGAATPRG